MQKRKPITPEHLIKDERPVKDNSARRKGRTPYQERISVKDIPTNSTLSQFIADENEEMRRIVTKLEGLDEQIAAAGGGTLQPGQSQTPTEAGSEPIPGEKKANPWALTTEHNDDVITAKVVQDLDYHDTGEKRQKYEMGIFWELTQQMLEAALKTLPAAKKTRIKAWAATNPAQFLDWLDLCLRPIKSIQGEKDDRKGYWNYTLQLAGDEWTPSPKKYYGTNRQGSKGFHLFPGIHIIEIPFTYVTVTASSTTLIPYGNLVVRTETLITQTFDADVVFTAEAAAVELMDETQINFAETGLYINQWHHTIASESAVDINIVTTATQGTGKTYIWYIETER